MNQMIQKKDAFPMASFLDLSQTNHFLNAIKHQSRIDKSGIKNFLYFQVFDDRYYTESF